MENSHIKQILSHAEWQALLSEQGAVLLYFSGAACAVCHALKPKVMAMMAERFPRVALAEVPTEQATELSAQLSVFALPTIIIYFDGQESARFSRAFSLGELEAALARPYRLWFES